MSKKLLMFLRSKFLIIQTSAHALVSSVKLLSICEKSYIFMLFLAERSGLVGRGLDSGSKGCLTSSLTAGIVNVLCHEQETLSAA